MTSQTKLFIFFLTCFGLTIVNSCTRYIDTHNKSLAIGQATFNFFSDSNVLIYESNVLLKADTEIYAARPFKAILPKKIKNYSFSNSEEFGIYYGKKQVAFIKINLSETSRTRDTMYVPSENEINQFVRGLNPTNVKFHIHNIKPLRNRKHIMIYRNGALILLYNISNHNIPDFVRYLSRITFQ